MTKMKNENFYIRPEQFDELKKEELHFINDNFNRAEQEKSTTRAITGLSLSGGGIRSAVFNLGVLQALAKNGLLQKVDYLSTVSGGGYIGSSLTWFLSKQTQKNFAEKANSDVKTEPDVNQNKKFVFGTGKNNFPYGTDEPGRFVTGEDSYLQQSLLGFLRCRGNYLTPGDNYTLLTLLAVALRTGMLSLMTWVPLISLVMLLLINIYTSSLEKDSIPVAFKFIGSLGLLSIIGFSAVGTIMAFIISFKTNKGKDDESFKYRLLADKYANKLLNIAIVFIGIFLISWIGTKWSTSNLNGFNEISYGLGTNRIDGFNKLTYGVSIFLMISGILAGLVALFKPDSQIINKIILPAASGLLSFGLLLCAYQLAYITTLNRLYPALGFPSLWNYVLYAGIAIAVILCLRTNLNDISIARFYRDRLKETFMADAKSLNPDRQEIFSKEAYLKDMCQRSEKAPYQGPYHIINANAIFVDSKQSKYNKRGGDSFIFSPLYCGSKATGWRETSDYLKGEVTLATAMAVSGAAVNPHSGSSGRGVTRNKAVSFILGILNLRLGIWLPNPNPQFKPWNAFYPGNFLQSAWYGIKSWTGHQGYFEDAGCLQISDGGHFENLGVYELIRRELDLIIISDASADVAFTFADFRNALRLAEADLNVEIKLDDNEKLSNLMPDEGKAMGLPMAEAQKGYLSGTIRYKNNNEGRFIYLKSTMIGGQRIRTKSYKLEYPRFPDQPTSDQFFDESQFSAYRDLGYTIACDMLENCNLSPLESRAGKERRSDIERRRNDIGFTTGNRRKQQRRETMRRVA